ncbi:MAG TPA: hypothetical protein VMG60_21815 [Burkholderiaceae bacterium]|nr:hypothetical protein [Burkholderiaceae bacterium]
MRRTAGPRQAPTNLEFVQDTSRLHLVVEDGRDEYVMAEAGAMGENAYLYCAEVGLAWVLRALIDRKAVAEAMQRRPA